MVMLPREMLLEVLIVNCLLYKGIDETSWFQKIMDSFKKNIYYEIFKDVTVDISL